jgi:hypothetical protein
VAVEHYLEGAVDLGLVNGLEDVAQGLDRTGSIPQMGWRGKDLGRGGIGRVEVDGGQGAAGAPVYADGLPRLDDSLIAKGFSIGDHVEGGGNVSRGRFLGHEPGHLLGVVFSEGLSQRNLGRGLGSWKGRAGGRTVEGGCGAASVVLFSSSP